jgi:hypothetical protein
MANAECIRQRSKSEDLKHRVISPLKPTPVDFGNAFVSKTVREFATHISKMELKVVGEIDFEPTTPHVAGRRRTK